MATANRADDPAQPTAEAKRALPFVLVVLTVVTGMVDAVSYLGLGHVFTANMTGNIVLLGFGFAGAGQVSITASLLALACFLAGAALGGRLIRIIGSHHYRWMGTALALEVLFVVSAAGAALPRTKATDDAVIALLAAGMGIRNASVRRLAIPDLTTTVLTLTLTGLAADTQLTAGEPWNTATRRVASVIALLAGATFGALLLRVDLAAPLVVAAVIVATTAAAYLLIGRPTRRR
jgi:uncharacterized membrane protein YoaK (UPF0700 family)